MTTTVRTPTTQRVPMNSMRKTALVAGGFYLLTFVSSIPALFLLGPVLDNPDYIISSGADTRVLLGCFLDVINALACIGTAVALFPWSNARTKHSRSASSPLVSLKPPSSPSAS